MYQVYIVAPMVKAGMTYIRVGLIYKPHGLFVQKTKDAPHFSGLSSIDVKVRSMWLLVRCTSFEKGGVLDPMQTWIYVNSIIPCPGVIDKEGADITDNYIQDDDHLDSLLPWD